MSFPSFETFREYVKFLPLGRKYYAFGTSLKSDYDRFVQDFEMEVPEALGLYVCIVEYTTAQIKRKLKG